LWSRISFQDLTSYISSILERLHDIIIVWLTVILLIVIFVRLITFLRFKRNLYPDSLVLETTWTIIPIIILVLIAFPRLWLLCSQDSFTEAPFKTLKMISNQWNWQSESEDLYDHLLDSDCLDTSSSFEVPVCLNSGVETRIITVRTDVLHSLGFPSLGLKLDTAPGRIRATIVERLYPGVFNGSCYELCGRGHRAIPIRLLILYRFKFKTVGLQSLKGILSHSLSTNFCKIDFSLN